MDTKERIIIQALFIILQYIARGNTNKVVDHADKLSLKIGSVLSKEDFEL